MTTSIPYSNARRALLLLLPPISLFLAGCSSLTSFFEKDPLAPKDAQPAFMVLHGTGTQQFQCVSDKNGRYWRFITPEVLLADKLHRIVARQGAEFSFFAPDGSQLKSKIVKWVDSPRPETIKHVLFATTSMGKKGVLSNVKWVKRDASSGGIPSTVCSASQLGMVLKVRFEATYSFYH